MNVIWIPQAVAIMMLLLALNPANPYGYYTLLRIVICGIFTYLAIRAFKQHTEIWGWILAVTAALYNPIIRVHLTREVWSVINVLTILLAVGSVVALKSQRKPK